MAKKEAPPELEDNDSEFAAVFSDLMSFLAGLFILLFTIVNTKQSSPQYFAEMSVKFSGKKVQDQQQLSAEDIFVTEIKNFIQEEQLSQYALIVVDEQRIRLILNDPILFQSGTHILKPKSKTVLNGLLNLILKVKNPMIIEGHTDDIPVKPGGKYRSNWDLAYYRAAAVTEYFINKGVKASRLSIASFGDQRPIARNKTSLARKKNRRIELNVIRIKKK